MRDRRIGAARGDGVGAGNGRKEKTVGTGAAGRQSARRRRQEGQAAGTTETAGHARGALAARAASVAKGNGRLRYNVAPLPDPPRIERRRSRLHGWGVFALETIPKNKRIIDYAGEKITNTASSPREERYLRRGHIWCFKINRRWAVDAAVGGNIARFINHACRPNCYSHIVDDVIWIRAARTIRPGEELTYDYHTGGTAEIPCRCRPGCPNSL